MRWFTRRKAILIILLALYLTFLFPVFLLSGKSISSFGDEIVVEEVKKFLGEFSRVKKKATDDPRLNAIELDLGDVLKEPAGVVYRDRDDSSSVSGGKDAGEVNGLVKKNDSGTGVVIGGENQQKTVSVHSEGNGLSNQTGGAPTNGPSRSQKDTNERIGMMKDQLTAAKVYLNSTPPNSDSQLVTELRQLLEVLEHAVGKAKRDSDLSSRDLQSMKSMEVVLSKAIQVSECSDIETNLRDKFHNTEEKVLALSIEITYLTQLAAKTTPKGLYCLSMRLTVEYFSLRPIEQELPNKQRFQQKDLYHYAIFSNNVIACAVVVNSAVSTSTEPEKIVFHVVTDDLHLRAITMWFLANPPGKATIQVQRIEDFRFLPSSYISTLEQANSRDQSFFLAVNHLHFYLPEIFPMLDRIVLLDHDVVVQRDLRGLWNVDMKGKVNGAVETCGGNDSSHRLDMFVNFSDPTIARNFNAQACTWTFGMNVFNLQEWRKRHLTSVYRKWLEWGKKKKLWRAGRLPLGLVTFYNLTMPLDRQWHVVGLGHNPGVGHEEIEKAAVIHYDGNLKPWLAIGIKEYGEYWKKFVKYDHPYLQQCKMNQ